ncbi:DUF1236 domain-containing protein [Bradyrhizobium sp. BRP23]|uniref:DUF1236 domain-containing protein n=1 Tax=Bradyrhizobium sp. BRP23 TaxID=2793820 RepID=UPI001CD52942|nr:DUF1236 domain-containing protein [Bradyrhizobium sp. BRP23]MCA1381111.1 DUF1236 domain-containing protein [Bradyrhizobium sp. BRP05]MCA1418768.1 DUF1236 domain-containing protein [Bradyrhizobium sp. BRP23]
MLNRFMISVAAVALVAGTGLANAQGNMGRDSGGGAGGAQMQHSQPSGGAAERGGSMSQDKGTVGQAGGSGTMKSEDKSGAMKDERSSGGAMNKNAAEDKSGTTKGQRTDDRAQGQMDKSQQDKSKSMSQDTSKSGAKDQKDMKAEGSKGGTSTTETRQGAGTTSTNQNVQGQTGTSSTQNAQGQSSTTVGQAGAAAKLSTEQRTQITSVIREQRVAPVTNVNFSISVGTRIPREGITLHALPSRVVSIYPEWRSYKYVLVREEIVIIDPDTYEIVAVLNV